MAKMMMKKSMAKAAPMKMKMMKMAKAMVMKKSMKKKVYKYKLPKIAVWKGKLEKTYGGLKKVRICTVTLSKFLQLKILYTFPSCCRRRSQKFNFTLRRPP